MRTILVTGATGTLGTHLTHLLRQDHDHVRTLSRHPDSNAHAIDLRQGTGLDQALQGVHTLVHLASTPPEETSKPPPTSSAQPAPHAYTT